MFCREQAVQVHREVGSIHDRGAELVLVGNGSRHHAQGFKQALGLTCPLYVDTKLDTYRALEMKRGLFATLGSPAAWKHMARALRSGFRQGITRGDAWQLGGVLIVKPGGEILYRHRSREAGDHPPLADVLAAL